MIFNVTPIPKPRMTRADSWKKRPCVVRYWAFKDELTLQARAFRYEVEECLEIEFHLPIPKSWSKKKKAEMLGKPHQQTPDIDNLSKAFMDSLCKQDNFVWHLNAKKFWSEKGFIKINRI